MITDDEKKRTEEIWNEIKKNMPSGIKLVSNNVHAFGSQYNGFFIVEFNNFDEFIKWWKGFKDRIRWYVVETRTYIGEKRD